jgi:hypothetical protein
MQEKELEAELEKKKKEFENPPRPLSKLYSSVLPEESLQKIKDLVKKYNKFDGWNLDIVDDKCLVYSSLSSQELVARKNKSQFATVNSYNSRATIQLSAIYKELIDGNKKISLCLLLLLFYLIFAVNGMNVWANSILFLLVPFLMITSMSISHLDMEKTQTANSLNMNESMFKINTKFIGHPDDLAVALSKSNHRYHWDLNIIGIDQTKGSDFYSNEMQIQYASVYEGMIFEKVVYEFYQESDDHFYILEKSSIDRFPNTHQYRLFYLKQFDPSKQDCYSLTVYGELNVSILKHKSENEYKLSYIKGLITYVEISDDLPSIKYRMNLTRETSFSQEDQTKLDGRIKFSFKKMAESLEQIDESAELRDEDDIEEYKMSQLNIKDTLLTVDEFNSIEGESQECNSNVIDDASDNFTYQRTESDDLSLIKHEALAYDKRKDRFISKDSKELSQNFQEDKHLNDCVSEGSCSEDETQKEDSKMPNNFNLDSVINIQAADTFKLNFKEQDTKNGDVKKADINGKADSNGAVASPFKKLTSTPNPSLGVSTIDFNWKPNKPTVSEQA